MEKQMINRFSVPIEGGKVLHCASRYTLEHIARLGPVALYSGGFDPLHEGHVACVLEAVKRYSNLVVIANNDGFLKRKRSEDPYLVAPLLPLSTRLATLAALQGVVLVVEAIDENQTVCSTINGLASLTVLQLGWFVNGGDRTPGLVPEEPICASLGIEMVWGCGGDNKPQCSSDIVIKAAAFGAVAATDRADTRWGTYCTIQESPGRKVKVLKIRPGTGLSLQYHEHRREEWRVLAGEGVLCLGKLGEFGQQLFTEDGVPELGQRIVLRAGVVSHIEVGQVHFVYATSAEPLVVREVQTGSQTDEADIVRFGDPFHQLADVARCRMWLPEGFSMRKGLKIVA
jgi:mannose-6-phosphate isomerase-like protein (cupin superfamily)